MEQIIKQLIEEVKECFESEYRNQVSDQEALGIAISKYFKWSGEDIFKTAQSAFEDSNYHTFNEKFEKIWNDED